MSWDKLYRLYIGKSLIALYISNMKAFIIPRRFINDEMLQDIVAIAAEALPDKKIFIHDKKIGKFYIELKGFSRLQVFNNTILTLAAFFAILFASSYGIYLYAYSYSFSSETWISYVLNNVIIVSAAIIATIIGSLKKWVITPLFLIYFAIDWVYSSLYSISYFITGSVATDAVIVTKSILQLILSILIITGFINLLILKKDIIFKKQ